MAEVKVWPDIGGANVARLVLSAWQALDTLLAHVQHKYSGMPLFMGQPHQQSQHLLYLTAAGPHLQPESSSSLVSM